ncbi:MAG TPA: PIG-L family deacetylase [Planctomycetota bacterium]|nr:PIG-L family deacetylase [Planctomycetota bacterium]
MSAFPALRDPRTVSGRVLVFAAHPDDEVLGCGGLIALCAEHGARVRVLIATDGAAGLTGQERANCARLRADESRRAGMRLDVADFVLADLPDGRLGQEWGLTERLAREIEEFEPDWVLAPSPLELHADHVALASAAAAALARRPAQRALLYGVNTPVLATVLFDVSSASARKRDALLEFTTQDGAELARKAAALDSARTMNIEAKEIRAVEGFVEVQGAQALEYARRARGLSLTSGADAGEDAGLAADPWAATAVISTWNKCADLCENLDGLRAQTRPFAAIVVVDNASRDDTQALVRARYPEVRLIVMPHSKYGACETFNIGFASAKTPLIAILDDDVVLPPEWLARTVERLQQEPASTAVVSTEVVEPEMPASYLASTRLARERYMSTFRGCASLVRADALRRAGGYDERLYIYGNERDLTCRLLNLGYRVLQVPSVRAFHKTPFGIKLGSRSLYYHARNAWLTMLKYAPARDLVRLPWLVLTRVVLRGGAKEKAGEITDATGTIGIGRSLRETPGATWILLKAGCSVLANVPYCLRHREPCRAPDFELPLQ